MSKPELDQITTGAQQIERASEETPKTFNPWLSWNMKITQGRELGEQIIALASLVAQLAKQLEQLSTE